MHNIYTQTVDFWDHGICGSHLSQHQLGSLEFFEDFDKKFVTLYPYFSQVLDFSMYKNKKVLVIGLGSGYELGQLAKVASKVVGLDISPQTVALANKRKEVYGFDYETVCCSATSMPFEDKSFDAVVSIGCLHHIPDTQDVVAEINRVLVDTGTISAMLYYKYSIRALLGIHLKRLFLQTYNGLTFAESICLAYDGLGCPYVRLYSKKDVLNMFQSFDRFKFYVRNFDSTDFLPKIGNILPRNFYLNTIGKVLGLDLYFTATKKVDN